MVETTTINTRAYTEIVCLLNHFQKEYIRKLPKKLIMMFWSNYDERYFIEIETDKSLDEQNICDETKKLLAVLKYNFWSDANQKKQIEEILLNNENKKIANSNNLNNKNDLNNNESINGNVLNNNENIFNNNVNIQNNNENISNNNENVPNNNNQIAVYKKESKLKRFFEKIFHWKKKI